MTAAGDNGKVISLPPSASTWSPPDVYHVKIMRLPAPWSFRVLSSDIKDLDAWKSQLLDRIIKTNGSTMHWTRDTIQLELDGLRWNKTHTSKSYQLITTLDELHRSSEWLVGAVTDCQPKSK